MTADIREYPKKVRRLFEQQDDVETVLVGVYDRRTNQNRFWNFAETHFNMFEPAAIFTRDPSVKMQTKEHLLTQMVLGKTVVIQEPLVEIISQDPVEMDAESAQLYHLQEEKIRAIYSQYREEMDIREFLPSKSILIIGDEREALPMQRCFESLNWICRTRFTEAQIHKKHLLMEEDPAINDNYDHVLIIHNYDAIDIAGITIPVHFYTKQGVHPNLPLYWTGENGIFFHAYLGAPEQYKMCHPYAMSRCRLTALIPHAWDQSEFPQDDTPYEKLIEFGFMGSIDNLPHPYDTERQDYLSVHMRDDRAHIIMFAEKHLNLTVVPRGTQEEYLHFLKTTKYILNVGCIFGLINERQYHAMVYGGILVQKYYKHLDSLGYKHQVNCILFKTEEDLKLQIGLLRRKSAEKLAAIAAAGKEWAFQNTLQHRVKQMRDTMLTWREH